MTRSFCDAQLVQDFLLDFIGFTMKSMIPDEGIAYRCCEIIDPRRLLDSMLFLVKL